MKGDFSRDSYRERKHYQEVLLQQGRVQLDADWNEAEAIRDTRDRRAMQDVVGHCGSPNAGFHIVARRTLDPMESVAGWTANPVGGHLCVDYVDYLRGTASLRASQATEIRKTLAAALNLKNTPTLSFAVKSATPPAPPPPPRDNQKHDTGFSFFVSDGPDGTGKRATWLVDGTSQIVGVWRVYTFSLDAPTTDPGVDYQQIRTLGFTNLKPNWVYHFDSIQYDVASPSVALKDILPLDDLEDLNGWGMLPGSAAVSLDDATLFNGHPTVKIAGPGEGLKSFPQARDLRAYSRFVVVTFKSRKGAFVLKPSAGARIDLKEASVTTAANWKTYLFDLPAGADLSAIVAYGFADLAAADTVNVAQVLGVLDLSGNFFILGGDDDRPGRLYVDGVACQKEAPETYYSQRDYPEPLGLGLTSPGADGRIDLVYADVWQRHITCIEDPALREVALAGPDTCTRLQTIAQVKVLQGDVASSTDRLDCGNIPDTLWRKFAKLVARGAGRLSTIVSLPSQPTSLCEIAPDADYLGLDNRLYRVEIHDPGAAKGLNLQFKWSRDNGANAVAIAADVRPGQNPQTIALERLGRDRPSTLAVGDLVEVGDDLSELADARFDADGLPVHRFGELRTIKDVDPDANTITLTAPLTHGYTVARHAKVRRWDGTGDAAAFVDTQATPQLDFGDGVRISFDVATGMQSGDYWQFTARGITGQVEALDQAPPAGVIHRYCPLALIRWRAVAGRFEIADIADCRPHLPALTRLAGTDVRYDDGCCGLTVDAANLAAWHGDVLDGTVSNVQQALDTLCAREHEYLRLRYVSGDGQEGTPDQLLLTDLVVAVENVLGEPQDGVQVDFVVKQGDGTLSAASSGTINGEARVSWKLGPAPGLNLVRASLHAPQPQANPEIVFNARGTAADPGCCCTITVGDGEISHGHYQAEQLDGFDGLVRAIRHAEKLALKPGRVTVCLLGGTFDIEKTIVVGDPKHQTRIRNIVISGYRLETMLKTASGPVFQFESCDGLELHDLQIVAQGAPAVTFEDCSAVTIEGCNLQATGSGAVTFEACTEVTVEGCDLLAKEVRPAKAATGCLVINQGSEIGISRNKVRVSARTVPDAPYVGGIIVLDLQPSTCVISGNEVTATDGPALNVTGSEKTVVIVRDNLFRAETRDTIIDLLAISDVAMFVGNHVHGRIAPARGRSASPIKIGEPRGQVTFNSNYCACAGKLPGTTHVTIEAGRGALATGNHCLESEIQKGSISLLLKGPKAGQLSAAANVTSNGVELDPADPAGVAANLTGVPL